MTWICHNSFGEERWAELDSDGRPVQIIIRRDLTLNFGDIVSAKITAFNPTLHGYFAATDRGDLFIPTTKPFTVGQTISVQITKEKRIDKEATAQLITTQTPIQMPAAESVSADDMDTLIDTAMAPSVILPNGAELHIERTRVCWTIDVDSGSADLPLDEINQSVLSEIARQITLKNVGGLILIDFAGSKRGQIKSAVKNFTPDDLTTVHGWTKSGLFELERRRTRASLWDVCADTNPIAVYYRVRRAMDRHPTAIPRVAPDILKILKSQGIHALPLFDHPLSYFEFQEK